MKTFWTRDAAILWRDKIGTYARAYRYHANIGRWIEMSRGHLEEE